MKKLLIILCAIGFSSCGQIKNIMDGTEKLPEQIAETNRGMAQTNEKIRKQGISVALEAMGKEENRKYLNPIPGKMLPYANSLASLVTVDEVLLLAKNTLKQVNEETFNNRYPDLDPTKSPETLEAFEHDKMAELMMITAIAGFLPDDKVAAMIEQESEEGAYQDILFQVLMLRSHFNSELMLNASVMNSKLSTVGKINKAIEYNAKVDFVAKLEFADRIGLKITGFTTPDKNMELKLDSQVAPNNWKRILSAAKADFTPVSHKKDPAQKQQSMQKQAASFNAHTSVIVDYLKSWGIDP